MSGCLGAAAVILPGRARWRAGRSQQPGSSLLTLRLPSARHTVGTRRGLLFPPTLSCRLAKEHHLGRRWVDSHNWRKRLSTLILALPSCQGPPSLFLGSPGMAQEGGWPCARLGGQSAMSPLCSLSVCRHKCFHFHPDLFFNSRWLPYL